MDATPNVTCYGQIPCRTVTQEWYETATRDGAARARHLRSLGIPASSEAMGSQVTNVGRVKMTLVTIQATLDEIPPVRIVRGV